MAKRRALALAWARTPHPNCLPWRHGKCETWIAGDHTPERRGSYMHGGVVMCATCHNRVLRKEGVTK